MSVTYLRSGQIFKIVGNNDETIFEVTNDKIVIRVPIEFHYTQTMLPNSEQGLLDALKEGDKLKDPSPLIDLGD